MSYKNNYQRKQAIWREKWLKKEEARLKQRDFIRLKKDIVNFSITVQEACLLIHDELDEIMKSAGEIVYKTWLELTK